MQQADNKQELDPKRLKLAGYTFVVTFLIMALFFERTFAFWDWKELSMLVCLFFTFVVLKLFGDTL